MEAGAADPGAEGPPPEVMSLGLRDAISKSTQDSFADVLGSKCSGDSVFEEVEEEMPPESDLMKRGLSSDEDGPTQQKRRWRVEAAGNGGGYKDLLMFMASGVTKQQEEDAADWPVSESDGGASEQQADSRGGEDVSPGFSPGSSADVGEESASPGSLVPDSGVSQSGGMALEDAPVGGVDRAGRLLLGKECEEEKRTMSGLSAPGCPAQLGPRAMGRGGGQAPGPVRGSRIPGSVGGMQTRTVQAQRR